MFVQMIMGEKSLLLLASEYVNMCNVNPFSTPPPHPLSNTQPHLEIRKEAVAAAVYSD
jgi:hypothetical protein